MTTIRTGLTDALYALARTLTKRDAVAVELGMTGNQAAVRAALLTLATASPDLADDDRLGAGATVVAAYTPTLTSAARDGAWDRLCEAVQLAAAWAEPGVADVLAEPLPYGTSAEATVRAALDQYTDQREAALDALTAPAVWAAA